MRRLMRPSLFLLTFSLACASGCAAPRTVLVEPGQPVKIGPAVKGKVYVLTDKGWELSANAVTIPEGWYALPPEEQK